MKTYIEVMFTQATAIAELELQRRYQEYPEGSIIVDNTNPSITYRILSHTLVRRPVDARLGDTQVPYVLTKYYKFWDDLQIDDVHLATGMP